MTFSTSGWGSGSGGGYPKAIERSNGPMKRTSAKKTKKASAHKIKPCSFNHLQPLTNSFSLCNLLQIINRIPALNLDTHNDLVVRLTSQVFRAVNAPRLMRKRRPKSTTPLTNHKNKFQHPISSHSSRMKIIYCGGGCAFPNAQCISQSTSQSSPNSPTGGNRASSAICRAITALATMGTMTPCAPASKACLI